MAFNKKFYAGSFCSYKASKRGYFDVSGFFRVCSGRIAKNDNMVSYSVPEMSFHNYSNKSTLAFSQGLLPDYTILPAQVCILAKTGASYLIADGAGNIEINNNGVLDNVDDNKRQTIYNLFIKDGKPLLSLESNVAGAMYCGTYKQSAHTPRKLYKINCNTSLVSFSGNSLAEVSITNGYMDSLYTFPNQNVQEYECDIILKVKTGSSLSGVHKLLKFGGFWFGINNGNFAYAALSTVVNGVAATANKSYWLRVMQTGFDVMNYTLLYLEDDGTYTFDTLPGLGQWQIGAYGQFANCAAHNNALRFNDMVEPWGGAIDLLNCHAYIKYIDTTEWVEVWHAIDTVN